MTVDIWTLIQNDNFLEACEVIDSQYETTNNVLLLRNKIYALFHLRKFDDVIFLSKKIIEIRNGETDTDFINLGIGYWAISDYEYAINAWKNAQTSIYKDVAGGIDAQIYLYFAAIKTSNDDLKKYVLKNIKKILKSKKTINWPGALGSYLLGEINFSQAMKGVSEIPILRERQLCQGEFVSAIKELEIGNINLFYKHLRFCVNLGSAAYLEQTYYLAMIELEKSLLPQSSASKPR